MCWDVWVRVCWGGSRVLGVWGRPGGGLMRARRRWEADGLHTRATPRAGYAADHSAEPPSAATVTVFKDPRPRPRRAANCVHWHPDAAAGKAVVCYSVLGFQQQPPGMALGSCVFDVASPNAPDCELLGVSQLVVAKYNYKDSNLIGAGQYNGQFAVFDTRKGPAPVETTPIDISHRRARTLSARARPRALSANYSAAPPKQAVQRRPAHARPRHAPLPPPPGTPSTTSRGCSPRRAPRR